MKTLLALVVAVLLAAAPASAELTRIGAAAAVSGAVRAASTGAAARALKSGAPVYLNDRITTDGSGRLQVLLLDETVFTVGPSSDMVLDEFVYDPTTSAGKVSAKVTKGVFRFVTGKVARQDPANMKVSLPVGTIGIRGTIVGGQAGDQGSTIVLLGPGANNNAGENAGAMGVSNEGSEVVVDRPGYGTTVAPGQPPSPPSDMSGFAAQLSADLGEAGGEGGSTSAGEGGESASEDSGQDAAEGGTLAAQTEDLSEETEELGETSSQASQDLIEEGGIPDGVATWDHVRTLTTGLGWYNASGSYTCSGGGLCSVGGSGTLSFTLEVDFANRTYGGGTSQINLSGGPINDSVTITNNSFETLAGDAVIALGPAGTLGVPSNGGDFNGSSIKLLNDAGEAAADASLDLNYVTSGSGDSADGQVTASKGELPPQ